MADVQITLLGRFELECQGGCVRLPHGAGRVLGYLALRGAGALRTVAAEALWPDRRGGRACANLRSALWQVRSLGCPTLIDCLDGRIRLSPRARIDLHDATGRAREVAVAPSSVRGLAEHDKIIMALSRELLPDWSDDWLLVERERWDQTRVHALEVLARRLIAAEQYLPALEAALTAVAIEPVRESANRAVMEVHIAEGNPACAIKHYRCYRDLMARELGVIPSPQMNLLATSLFDHTTVGEPEPDHGS